MTRLAVLSDIHGNLPALEAVIADMQPHNIDHVVVVGDSINWGPFSRQVMERLYAEDWAVIRGNNEYYLLDYATPREPKSWSHFTLPPWLHDQLGDKWINIIASLPDTLQLRFRDAPPVRVWHAIPENPWVGIFPSTTDDEVRAMLAHTTESTLICGHTHLPIERRVDDWQIINPGTVGMPLDGTHAARYAIMQGDETGWRVEFRQVDYDDSSLFEEYERQRFVERCGVTAYLIIKEVETGRLQLYPFWHWLEQTHPGAEATIALADEFLATDGDPFRPLDYRLQR